MPIPTRGMRNIRTNSGRGKKLPHKAFMEISCLEMEKARRGRERESALETVRLIDERFVEIAAEQKRLLEEAGVSFEELKGPSSQRLRRTASTPSDSNNSQGSTSSGPSGSGFKIKY